MVLLPSGRQVLVDEKKREKDYGDLLLEEWSVALVGADGKTITGKKIGWALDSAKRCDFIAYSIPISGRCYLLPFELTRLAFEANIKAWKKAMGDRYPLIAKNSSYVTVNVSVQWDVFKAAIAQQMHRKWGSAAPLPIARTSASQLDLFWS
jgi:hypothetical protein